MSSTGRSRYPDVDIRRRRSRSASTDSEEDRRRIRRRNERENGGRSREDRPKDDRYGDDKHKDDRPRDDRHRDDRPRDNRPRDDRPRDGRPRDDKSREDKSRDDRTRDDRYRNDRSGIRNSFPRRSRSPAHSKLEHGTKRDRSPRRGKEKEEAPASRRSKGPLPSQLASFKSNQDPSMELVPAGEEVEKLKPSLVPTGLLAAASNSVAQIDGSTVVLKYHEPPEARKPPPKDEWKLFVFKGPDIVETIDLSKRSCWLIGRELAVVDLPAEHPSLSKQHAVIQFRYIEKKNEYGDRLGKVRPYLIDLDSANGTSLNKDEVPPSRYLELRDKDMLQFAHSTREYVLMLSPKS